jgi:hypothetical protein
MKTLLKILAFITIPLWILPMAIFYIVYDSWKEFSYGWDNYFDP